MFEIKLSNINSISAGGDQYETVVKLYNQFGSPIRLVLQTETARALADNLEIYFRARRDANGN